MLQQLQHLDLAVLAFFNGFANRWHGVDLFFAWQEDNNILKGIAFMVGFVWYWFEPHPECEKRREIIVNMALAVGIGLVINRVIAVGLPFRVRPMYDPTIPFNNPGVDRSVHFNLENWSSFPSDTATYFFVMVGAFWLISRRAGIAYGIYGFLFILVTRIYLGVHYPSDILAGAVLGFGTMIVVAHAAGDRLARRLLIYERSHPQWFYALAFLGAYEVGVMLEDVRQWQHGMLVSLQRRLQQLVHGSPGIALGTSLALAIAIGMLAWLWRRGRAHGPVSE